MNLLSRLFGKKNPAAKNEQAVLVYLDAMGLPDEIYEEYDLSTLEDQLIAKIRSGSLGEFDGNEMGDGETVPFMYGADAERLFAGIEATLRRYPLCQNARIIIRRGNPGAPQRELRLTAM
jgi:hypothetical protein